MFYSITQTSIAGDWNHQQIFLREGRGSRGPDNDPLDIIFILQRHRTYCCRLSPRDSVETVVARVDDDASTTWQESSRRLFFVFIFSNRRAKSLSPHLTEGPLFVYFTRTRVDTHSHMYYIPFSRRLPTASRRSRVTSDGRTTVVRVNVKFKKLDNFSPIVIPIIS